uniref:CSON007371 protein n=1 Tax=Culicoides sonorensis TaxID=179676 RepID=A0A336JZ19_CULSO
MIHHSSKYQQNSITHFLSMHSTSVVETVNSNLFNHSISNHEQTGGMQLFQSQFNFQKNDHSSNDPNFNKNVIDLSDQTNSLSASGQSIDGKSFTIAAILGLNNNNSSSRNFNEVVNLSLNPTNKLFGGLDRLPQMFNGSLSTMTVSGNESNNGHTNYHHPSGHALKSLQQQFSQHNSSDFLNREKYRNGHQQKQIETSPNTEKTQIKFQNDSRIPSLSPELTVCSESMDANTESEIE